MPRFIPFLVLALAIVGTPVRTASRTDSWRWQMAFVDATQRASRAAIWIGDDGDWDDWILVARVGRPVNRVFPVHFVLPDDDCEDAEAREAVGRSLDYYLVSSASRPLGIRHLSHDDTRRPVIPGALGLDPLRGRIWTFPERDCRRAHCGAEGADAPVLASDRPAAFACDRERRMTLAPSSLEVRRPLSGAPSGGFVMQC